MVPISYMCARAREIETILGFRDESQRVFNDLRTLKDDFQTFLSD